MLKDLHLMTGLFEKINVHINWSVLYATWYECDAGCLLH